LAGESSAFARLRIADLDARRERRRVRYLERRFVLPPDDAG
jgi:hypothetical protein